MIICCFLLYVIYYMIYVIFYMLHVIYYMLCVICEWMYMKWWTVCKYFQHKEEDDEDVCLHSLKEFPAAGWDQKPSAGLMLIRHKLSEQWSFGNSQKWTLNVSEFSKSSQLKVLLRIFFYLSVLWRLRGESPASKHLTLL